MAINKLILCTLSICSVIHSSLAASPFKPFYLAKVVDYSATIENTQKETLYQNVRYITNYMVNSEDAEILVFPEYALTGVDIFLKHADFNDSLITIPEVSPTPLCREEHLDQAISDFACASSKSYTVINMLEKSGHDVFSTNVVFNPRGAIIAKYRKINLSGVERNYLKAGTQVSTFESDFKSKFGVISSADIFHLHPNAKLLEQRVTDVIVTSALRSGVPFRISVSIFDGYAKKHGVNVIAAGFSKPENGYGGSGIFSPTSFNSFVSSVAAKSAIQKDVEVLDQRSPSLACNEHVQPRSGIIGHLPDPSNFITTRPDFTRFKRESILSNGGSETEFKKQLCSADFCCKFSISFNAALYNLAQDYQVAISDDACGLMACDKKDDASTCGSRHADLERSHFDVINIEVRFNDRTTFMYMPVTSDINLTPLQYLYCEDTQTISMSAKAQNAVIYMGFIRHNAISSSSALCISYLIFLLLPVVTLL